MIEVEIDEPAWTKALPDATALAEQAAVAALSCVIPDGPQDRSGTQGTGRAALGPGASPSLSSGRPPAGPGGYGRDDDGISASLVILLTDDAAVQDLNVRFRGQDKPTNVLSFPTGPNPEDHLGDLALAFGVCAAEAKAQGKTLADHLRHLTIHGVLHLLGYDHEIDSEAEAMEALERRILDGLGVADPYAAERDVN
ncbi:MAG: rRNA maturation RNase YbeY [Caulobacteraceae bacterium]|nr:rRNA maturation RNase YbeY [Caulobacteraceae bacterium]